MLDTNTVLAMWWFGDPLTVPLRQAIETDRVACLACPGMREELVYVLGRFVRASNPASADALEADPERLADAKARSVVAAFDRFCRLRPPPAPAHGLRCTDGSDQIFIDLAIAERAQALFSRDRAVLKLWRRAARLGVDIRRPDGWVADDAAGVSIAP